MYLPSGNSFSKLHAKPNSTKSNEKIGHMQGKSLIFSTPERLSQMEYGQQMFHHDRIMGRNWNNYSEKLTQPNHLAKASEGDENLKSQQIFHAIRRERNFNQKKSGRSPSYRELLEFGRAKSDSGTPRNEGINHIFPTEVQP
ncbi:hypothetical protein O181_004088 [Austropuccinia psidii MF-1]|uniref:Uncharacterized protein n=1 Tax=Austropuccinia psidii MF-1 TaxID=1389203 RepID=A0A9Q3BFN6_9BASI|nr:hypothetical protein [Austropuccinia psidii MF-1]